MAAFAMTSPLSKELRLAAQEPLGWWNKSTKSTGLQPKAPMNASGFGFHSRDAFPYALYVRRPSQSPETGAPLHGRPENGDVSRPRSRFVLTLLWVFVSMDAHLSATTCLASCGR